MSPRSDAAGEAEAEQGSRYWQVPLAVIDLGALSLAHFRSQVEPVEQLSEHDPVQTTWHVELPAQLALPLGPSVTLQLEPESQARLHEAPQLPEQLL